LIREVASAAAASLGTLRLRNLSSLSSPRSVKAGLLPFVD